MKSQDASRTSRSRELGQTLREINRSRFSRISNPPGCKKRASVALIIRVRPTFPDRASFDTSQCGQGVASEQARLDAFFSQEWVQRGDPEVLFIKRAARKGDRWNSHIAFPGGGRDPEDKDDVATSIRETREEIGMDLEAEHCLQVGYLSERVVTTWLGKTPQKMQEMELSNPATENKIGEASGPGELDHTTFTTFRARSRKPIQDSALLEMLNGYYDRAKTAVILTLLLRTGAGVLLAALGVRQSQLFMRTPLYFLTIPLLWDAPDLLRPHLQVSFAECAVYAPFRIAEICAAFSTQVGVLSARSRIAVIFTGLILLITSTVQVDVILMMSSIASVTCTNLPPGYCCQTPTFNVYQPAVPIRYPPQTFPLGIRITSLLANHVAGIYTIDGLRSACSNMPPFRTFMGPGSWYVPNSSLQPITGVSYVVLPKVMPVDTTTSEYLAAEGLLGLHSAGKQWTAPGVSPQSFFGTIPGSSGLKSRRSTIRGQRGMAYIGAPPRSRLPDVITVNGTVYRSTNNTSTLDFRGPDGQPLNTTTLGF
ncbi:MAG: hypothetical protein Q9182_000913 [Xanthomendoza sp. 2 TL-2023]